MKQIAESKYQITSFPFNVRSYELIVIKFLNEDEYVFVKKLIAEMVDKKIKMDCSVYSKYLEKVIQEEKGQHLKDYVLNLVRKLREIGVKGDADFYVLVMKAVGQEQGVLKWMRDDHVNVRVVFEKYNPQTKWKFYFLLFIGTMILLLAIRFGVRFWIMHDLGGGYHLK